VIDGPSARFGAEADLDRAIDGLVERDALEVPPYPAVALRVSALVRRRDYALEELARLVRADAALAADLLRLANSAWFGLAPVVSLEKALVRVGEAHVEELALASSLGAHALARGPLLPLRRLAWHDALASAVLCRELAKHRRLASDEAFACGLLHDFGRVVAIGAIERIAAGSRAMPARFWEDVVDRHHVRLGAIVAQRWGLPPAIADVVRLHHAEGAAGEAPELLALVRLADAVVRLLGDRAAATADDLAAVSALSEVEAAAFGRVLRVLPAFVESLERAPGPPDRPGLVEGDPADRGAGPGARVRVRIGGTDWEAIGVGPHQLAVRGGGALPEGGLVEVELLGPRPSTFHARVLLTWPEGASAGAVLMPFGLSGPALLDWRNLVPASATA
jgi:putative nucleotidyltransferase with HDIG domain